MKHIQETIKLLEYIQQNPKVTQRELVEKLNISLGKVNFLIKALAEKGVIKLNRFKKSNQKIAYLYLITPKGISSKARITKKFLKIKLKEYVELKEEIKFLKRNINNEKKASK